MTFLRRRPSVSSYSQDESELRLERPASLEAVRDDWRALAEQTGNVFATWEWASLWWRFFGAGKAQLVNACRDSADRVIGILPLYLWRRRPVRVARLLGHGPGDALGPICSPSDRPAVARALARSLAESRCDVLIGEQVPRSEGWSTLLGARVLREEASPVLRFDFSSWEDYLAGRSRNFREQVRRRERKLAREHELRYRLTDDPERLQEDLDTLFRLHRIRWSLDSPFSKAEMFHRAFARCAFERGWARLWFLEIDGEPGAAWYGFRFGDAESYYQAGLARGWEAYSPGFVLLAHSIREAVRDGAREYRFLRGGEEFKHRFASHDPGLETVAMPLTRAGGATVAAARALPAGLRRWFA